MQEDLQKNIEILRVRMLEIGTELQANCDRNWTTRARSCRDLETEENGTHKKKRKKKETKRLLYRARQSLKGHELEACILYQNKKELQNVVDDYKVLRDYSLRTVKSDLCKLHYSKGGNCKCSLVAIWIKGWRHLLNKDHDYATQLHFF